MKKKRKDVRRVPPVAVHTAVIERLMRLPSIQRGDEVLDRIYQEVKFELINK